MHFVSYLLNGTERLGLLRDNRVIDAVECARRRNIDPRMVASLVSLIEAEAAGHLDPASLFADPPSAAIHDASGVVLRAPLRPSTILCAGSNYAAHNSEKANTPLSGKEPEFFVKTADCVIGPDEGIILDQKLTKKLDCETELAVVIGKPGRHIPVEAALDHVFGYTIVNDVTARDRQVRSAANGMVWYELGRGKAFDTSAPLGPVVVTADEIGDPQALRISTRINGELRQNSSTSDMIWSCADLIHFFSTNFTLKPGMVIITGSPAGTAWSTDKELGGTWTPAPGVVAASRYCLPGDLIECEVEKIGVLRNPVRSSAGIASL
ncbi:fumarylacetoacetate hydrolase family protein [Bradyrhizobium sp. NP1]|uniref:fumarylacetoacetate hydrolase family protein n=1 Tax=Bradyrhizobium sp. NP1 TaxID=3049772 RepID=UPI0025A68F43|nr:fumarylacetoacetate hydrolase family protein [Bradyrhizobium sp. NP1]WJR77869.1 fumarylacetoacetate hydrolase family protein [Bradyrhizobium sp. NP1]